MRIVCMKQYSQPEFQVPTCPNLPGLLALATLLAVASQGLAHCDDRAEPPSSSPPIAWSGSASVDNAQGTSLHFLVSREDITVAMSLLHSSAGTSGFPGFTGEALDGLSIGMNFDSSLLAAGDLGLAGLGLFMFRPAGAGPLLPVYGRRPLRAERPDSTRYHGIILGKEGGLLVVHPLSDSSRLASGAWFSPEGSPFSIMMLAGSEPGQVSDDWYKADRVQADRVWGAASLAVTGKGKLHRMSLSGALVASAGLPGRDAMAARLEAMLAIRRLRIHAEASLASDDWRAPDGATAVPVRLDLSTLYRHRGLELSAAYRLVSQDIADEGTESGLRAHVQLANGKREYRLATTLSQANGQNIPDLTVDTSWKPGLFPAILPGLSIQTSWKSKDGLSERFDAGASLKGGRKLRWSMDTGLRYDTQGRHIKVSTSVMAPLGGSSLRFGLKSDGWIPLDGELPDAPLVLSVAWSISVP
ncbi:MAG: hypothetical protein ABIJ86_03360 [Spirochaetota bacterium]